MRISAPIGSRPCVVLTAMACLVLITDRPANAQAAGTCSCVARPPPNIGEHRKGFDEPDGTAFAAGEDRTCKNWTSGTQGSAMRGHSDRIGLRDDDASKSWNSSHPSRGSEGGCSQADLKSTGSDGLMYCFAVN